MLLASDNRRQLVLGSVELTKSLTVDPKFLGLMRSKGALGESDYQQINVECVNFRRNLQLIDVLLHGTDHTFNCFWRTLDETDQEHIKSVILTGCICCIFIELLLDALIRAVLSDCCFCFRPCRTGYKN